MRDQAVDYGSRLAGQGQHLEDVTNVASTPKYMKAPIIVPVRRIQCIVPFRRNPAWSMHPT